ncbi:Serine/threonine-protein kinase PrkC [Pirellula sp. SH-Sr6A]|uniref:serine/threonine protein kinase n=1 Tax=Pirellula sp. SH-Sr6A TaxID=1632865 RepID=UPI00078BBA8C|nr:serine/threonine-protein kinase [Pirellula sp. SH-Sr6A]AMV34784.1 Serine/threonine-protein kinase PrkC [Pirellula sp. SH-Sr6A]
MFAVLNRWKSPPVPEQPGTSLKPSPPNQNRNFGASMKFQYGNGDKPLDGYVIKRGVGTGGFGEVYFAESESGKEVALKRIQKNLEVEVRGVRHCLNLRHPNLVGIYDIRFDKEDQGWIVMEFIAGESLRDRIDRHSTHVDLEETISLFAQLAAGVAYLHDQGIVHRDLKPANVFIDNSLVKIGDYGLSKYISTSRRGGQTESVGTFHYMAPEIGKGQYGKEIDIYSLGVILYEMLTGVVPFDGESSQEIILKHLTADPDVSMLPQPFAYTIQKALAKNAGSRFSDCREMLAAIGWELDRSGMAIRSLNGSPNVGAMPPVLPKQPGPIPGVSPSGAKQLGNDHPTLAGGPAVSLAALGAIPLGPNKAFPGGHNAAAASQSPLYHEPVARAVHQAIGEAQAWFRSLPAGMRGVVIAFSIILLITNGGWIAPLGFMALFGYVIYYIVWFLTGGPARAQKTFLPLKPSFAATNHVPPVAGAPRGATVFAPAQPVAKTTPVPYRVALRNWQKDQREQLHVRGVWAKTYARTRSWGFSGAVIASLALASSLLLHARYEGDSTPWLGGIAWTGVMALLTSWTVIFFARRWETQSEDSIVYRFVLMSSGVMLGLASYGLSDWLYIPWQEITSTQWGSVEFRSPDWNKAWKGFYSEGGEPLLPAHIAYFCCLMWIVRWWRQADVLRRSRFSIWTIAWSVAMAALVQGLFAFPMPWCLLLAGVTSFAVQLASPWINYKEARLA